MTHDPKPDTELLEAWRDGDDRAGEQLYDRYADLVARFFENKVRDGAEDLIQVTFLRMIEGRERIREGSVRAYALGIARNVLREHLRRITRDKGKDIDPEVDSVAELIPGASTIAGIREEHRILLEGLRRIPLQQQILLELYYWEQLSSDEIAEILEIAPSSARSRLAKARELLAERMAEIAASPEALASTVQGLDTWAAELREQLGGPKCAG